MTGIGSFKTCDMQLTCPQFFLSNYLMIFFVLAELLRSMVTSKDG